MPGAISVTAGVALLVLAVTRAGDTLRATQPALLGRDLAAGRVRGPGTDGPGTDPRSGPAQGPGILGANLSLIAVGAFTAGQVLLVTLYLQEGRGLSPLLTGLCFVPQAAGSFALSRPRRPVPGLRPRRALALGLTMSLLALSGAAVSALAGMLPALLAALFVVGVANRISQVASTLADARAGRRPVRAGVTLSGCDAVCTLPNSGFCGWRTHCSAFSNA